MGAVVVKPLFLILCGLLSLATWANVHAQEPADVLVLGDSISAGFGIQVEQGWVALLENELRVDNPEVRLVNASISGETTQGGLTRLPQLLERHQPRLTIIELGGNDGLRGMPIKLIENNLRRLIELSQAANSQVLLIGVQIPTNYGARYGELFVGNYQKLAKQFRLPLVMFSLESLSDTEGWMQADGIHPTAKAQPLMMQWVLEKLP